MRNITSRRLDVPSIGFKVNRNEKLRRSPRKIQENAHRVFKEEKWKKSLSGCKFYLDVSQAKSIEIRHQILSLGGEVEEFLSKDIKIVITSQTTGNVSRKFIGNTPSNRPSLMQVISSKRAILQQPSPFSSDSPQLSNDAVKLKNNNISITRGKIALNKVLTTKHGNGSNDIIGKAIQLGVQVISIEDFTQCYMRKSNKEKDKKPHKMLCSNRLKKSATDVQVTRLKETFFKFEDKSRCFRPLVYQMKQWPKIHYKTCLFQCPFELPNQKQPEASEKPDPEVLTGELESDVKGVKEEKEVHFTEQSKSKESIKYRSKKCGYCDCCNIRYNDLLKHLQGESHRRFVENKVNFATLDKLIAGGTSFNDFLMHIKKRKGCLTCHIKIVCIQNFTFDPVERDLKVVQMRSVLKEKRNSFDAVDKNQKTLPINKSICYDTLPKKRLSFDIDVLQLSFSSNAEYKEIDDGQPENQLRDQCSFCVAKDELKDISPKSNINQSTILNNPSGRTYEGFSLLNVGDSFKEVKATRLKEEISKIDEKDNFTNLFDSEIGLENHTENIIQTPLESLFVSEIKQMYLPESLKILSNEEHNEKPSILSAQPIFSNEICDEKRTPTSKILRRIGWRYGKKLKSLSGENKLNEKNSPDYEFFSSCFSELSENAANLANTSLRSSEYEVLSESYFPRRIFAESGKAENNFKPPESCLRDSQYIRYDTEDQPKMFVKAVSKSLSKVILVQDFNEVLDDSKYSLNIEGLESKTLKKRIVSPEDYTRRRKRSRTSNNQE